ncbi:DNA-deoxyinosine glycosylase [Marilutibacter alkalisoli]|uniref:DNA-deoxyinosine glycosylase n=1 Tax=Marilutibacter alkalisoli TaxID=2591633 RepID=A0A514BR63_9GAMM|nr:DNA-deoxyinosine glycosylase [Lysobacter alkalisoli]QDH69815.1 DNA-deoxyinosine glycosylase [Lysobacter alkalisoli]
MRTRAPTSLLQGLTPIANPDAKVLILGSMPGAASLVAGQYYAHPQNRFWPFMGELVGALPSLTYPERVARLAGAGIAVWDVIGRCRREGSLDSAIRDVEVNDFTGFLTTHMSVRTLLFNGIKAEATFARLVMPTLHEHGLAGRLRYRRLPSTSPANASQPATMKLAAWREALAEARVVPAHP